MTRTKLALPLLFWSWTASGTGEAPKPEVPPANTSAPEIANQPSTTKEDTAPEPAPTLELRVVQVGSGLGLRVINAGTERVSLAPKVLLEGQDGAHGKDSGLTLQTSCQSQGCVTLAPGAEIDAPAWLERVSGERCGTLLVPKQNGAQALRVSTCGGGHSVSIPFVWPMQ